MKGTFKTTWKHGCITAIRFWSSVINQTRTKLTSTKTHPWAIQKGYVILPHFISIAERVVRQRAVQATLRPGAYPSNRPRRSDLLNQSYRVHPSFGCNLFTALRRIKMNVGTDVLPRVSQIASLRTFACRTLPYTCYSPLLTLLQNIPTSVPRAYHAL